MPCFDKIKTFLEQTSIATKISFDIFVFRWQSKTFLVSENFVYPTDTRKKWNKLNFETKFGKGITQKYLKTIHNSTKSKIATSTQDKCDFKAQLITLASWIYVLLKFKLITELFIGSAWPLFVKLATATNHTSSNISVKSFLSSIIYIL